MGADVRPAAEAAGRAPLRVLLAPDKFKGTLTAAQVCAAVAAGVAEAADRAGVPVVVTTVPVADGGDGTLVAAVASGFEAVPARATGPDGAPRAAAWARRGDEAVVELAAVSGLALLPRDGLRPLTSTSRGTGELVRAALDAGCRRVVLGIGGSASTDGGAGLVSALGARVLGPDGAPVADGGAALQDAVRLDLSGRHPALAEADLVVACDVDRPLTGPTGAAAVFGPQKGAGAADVAVLDAALGHWADLVADATGGPDHRDDPGAGAAGGVGFGAVAVLGARLAPGAPLLLALTGLDAALAPLGPDDLVVTGEGSLDAQTLHGKAPAGVAAAARAHGVPVVAVCGRLALDRAGLDEAGLAAAYALTDLTRDEATLYGDPEPLLTELGRRLLRDHLGRRPYGDLS
ncbi:glycerate kinase [Lapillicoccus jejuensis]|uniref:Glycerate kinase n=1 Tax=Lapillicoccus jejuensis TaxID=402171 RepID=A0A542E4J9_9MICO|nr:glycerate kinase [Lapillicoccus jejuensis]TQJ10270.1 glycerate kinase [Lapillicoccus jejuensis]